MEAAITTKKFKNINTLSEKQVNEYLNGKHDGYTMYVQYRLRNNMVEFARGPYTTESTKDVIHENTTYDESGRLMKRKTSFTENDPDSVVTQLVYSDSGAVATVTRRGHGHIQYTIHTMPDGSEVTKNYNTEGELLGIFTKHFDSNGRLIKKVFDSKMSWMGMRRNRINTFHYTYNEKGEVMTVEYYGGSNSCTLRIVNG